MAGLTAAILAFVVALVIAVVVIVVDRLLQGPRRPVVKEPASEPDEPDDAPVADHDEQDITVVGLTPITLDDLKIDTWADSEPEEEATLGATHRIVHDAEAADDEPSAAHALILVSAVGQTNRGLRRRQNEDSYAVLLPHNLFVVADGMGGYAGGEIASQLAVETIERAFDENDFTGAFPAELHRDGAQLAASIQMANRAVWDKAQANPELEGMGTTLVAARFSPRKERVYIGHVGDSRCYRLRNGTFEMLTQDHNLGQVGVKGRNAHMLTRAVGIGPAVEVDLILAEPRLGDVYLMCSDGLNKMINDAQIATIIRGQDDPEAMVERLVTAANEAGGKDNITVILIQVRKP